MCVCATHVLTTHTRAIAQPTPSETRHSMTNVPHTTHSTVSLSTAAKDAQKATGTAAPYPAAAQFPTGFQPVIQVTPTVPVVTLVPTAQLKMASLQLSQATEAQTRKRPSPVSETSVFKFGSGEKKKRAVVRPETAGAIVAPQVPTIHKISVPKPQSLELMQAMKCHLEPTNIQAAASQTEPSKPLQSELQLQLEPTSVNTANHQSALTQANVLQSSTGGPKGQLSAPVARVPVVKRAGSADDVGEDILQ